MLVAIVTDPAWTPMFAGASAVVLQIGGALQHGALCAREYGEPAGTWAGQKTAARDASPTRPRMTRPPAGKPAVSGIDVMASLKTGMQARPSHACAFPPEGKGGRAGRGGGMPSAQQPEWSHALSHTARGSGVC